MVIKQKVYWFLRKYLLIPSKRNLQYWSPSLEKSMGLLTLNLRLLTIRRREDAQNLSITVDIVTIYNGAEGKIQTGNVQSGRRYIILYERELRGHLCRLPSAINAMLKLAIFSLKSAEE